MSRVIRPVRNLQKKRHTRRLGDIGGSGEIRTHDGRKPTPVFKTGAFNHSATLPIGHLLRGA